MMKLFLTAACSLLVAMTLLGCFDPNSRVPPPEIDSAVVNKKAIELFDSNGDGTLDRKELASAPGLLVAFDRYDTDKDGKISAQEIAERIQAWQSTKVAMGSLSCRITYQGKPLAGATVRLIPEAHLAGSISSAGGVTDDSGQTMICIADEDLPASLKGVPGVHYGTYRVEITHPTIKLPAKYHQETILGHEFAHDIGNPYANFDLK